jgi:hypothetical protein
MASFFFVVNVHFFDLHATHSGRAICYAEVLSLRWVYQVH